MANSLNFNFYKHRLIPQSIFEIKKNKPGSPEMEV